MTAAPSAAAVPAPTKPEPTSAPSRWRLLEAAALLAAIAFSLLYWLRLPGKLPSEEDYLAVQHELLASAHPGDAVAVLPFWADRGKLFARGLPVIALPELALEDDAERYARLWVIAQPDLPRSRADEDLRALDQRLARLGPAKRFGPLSLSLYEPKPGRAGSYDFRAKIAAAQVDVDGQPCEALAGGHRCMRGSWNYVAPEWHEFDFLPRRCLWAHPVGEEPLDIRYAQVPLHGGVRGAFGLIGQAAELAQFAPVDLGVLVDGSQVAVLSLSPGDPGWHPFELDLPGLAPGSHDVAFSVTSHSNAMRHFCFDAVAF